MTKPNKTPTPSLLNPAFKYVNSQHTDIQATWRKFGWLPKGEIK